MLSIKQISKFFSRDNSSKDTAKNRLKLILIHDKTGLSSDILKKIKEEITEVLMKYTNVSREELDIRITATEDEHNNRVVPTINANIPIHINSETENPS